MTTKFVTLTTALFALACTVTAPSGNAQSQEKRTPPAPSAQSAPRFANTAGRAARRTPVVELVERVAPSVVNISTEQRVQSPFRANPFFNFFNDPFSGGMEGDDSYTHNSLGSGVIVDAAGYILTNNHVISGASKIQVTLVDRKTYTAEVVGADAASDLAVLKIEHGQKIENGQGNFPAVKLGSSSDLMIGETVIAIGNPYGLSHTVSEGILSAIGRTVPTGGKRFSDFLQTDAPINPGNSGGPLVNILGELIGVNSAILAQGQSIGFAIPIDRAKKIMGDLRSAGQVRALWLGMQVTEQTARQKLKNGDGLLVSRVYAGTAASRAGMKPGDLLTRLAGRELYSIADYDTALAALNPGDSAPAQVSARGKAESRTLRITAAPQEVSDDLLFDLLGIRVDDGEVAARITAVGTGTPAAEIGLARGDFILKINGSVTADGGDLKKAVAAALGQEGVSVVVQRGRGYYRITLPMGT